MSLLTIGKDNSHDIELYYKDWGSGQPVIFSHGWPLSADAWEDQMVFLATHGYRCIAHDRRGHGGSGRRPRNYGQRCQDPFAPRSAGATCATRNGSTLADVTYQRE
jgi:pimeloyl-ACP methyl ester carboxylesterase